MRRFIQEVGLIDRSLGHVPCRIGRHRVTMKSQLLDQGLASIVKTPRRGKQQIQRRRPHDRPRENSCHFARELLDAQNVTDRKSEPGARDDEDQGVKQREPGDVRKGGY